MAASVTTKIDTKEDDDNEGGFIISGGGEYISEQDQIKDLERKGTFLPLKNALVILNKTKPCVFDLSTEKWQLAENEEVIDTSKLAKDLDKGLNLQTK